MVQERLSHHGNSVLNEDSFLGKGLAFSGAMSPDGVTGVGLYYEKAQEYYFS